MEYGHFKDQLQRDIYLNGAPKRIVSLVPSQTELLYDLGLETNIVGITKFCVHPDQFLKEKQIVGGTKQVYYDKIRKLHPDIILCNKEENTKEMIAELETIAPVHISDVSTIEESLELIEMYGVLFGKSFEATSLITEINKERQVLKNKIAGLKPATVVYFIWKSPWMAAANSTFINDMLHAMGMENMYKHQERYPEVKLNETLIQPEFVFLSSEPFPFKDEHITELKTFYPNAKIILVDGEMFSWYGSRLKHALRYFRSLCEKYRF